MNLDWCWYLAVKILGMSEQEFLESTPRKLFALADIHKQVNSENNEDNSSSSNSSKEVYIDNISL